MPYGDSSPTGTEQQKCFSVPGFRPISRSDRVQMSINLLLYPEFCQISAFSGYRTAKMLSCTRPAFLIRSHDGKQLVAAGKRSLFQCRKIRHCTQRVQCLSLLKGFYFKSIFLSFVVQLLQDPDKEDYDDDSGENACHTVSHDFKCCQDICVHVPPPT